MQILADNSHNENTTLKELTISYYQDEYLNLKTENNELNIKGKIVDEIINNLWVTIGEEDIETSDFDSPIKPGIVFEMTVPLGIAIGKSAELQIFKGVKTFNGKFNGKTGYSIVGYGWIDKIKICNSNGNYYFESPLVLDYNKNIYHAWRNPADYLGEYLSDTIIAKSNEIVAGATSDYEKVLKIHDWVADNIYYDFDKFFGATSETTLSAESILESKRSICQGYSNLTQTLIQAQNIPCIIVSGYGLGIGTLGSWTEKTAATDETNHAWNEAFVDGRWIILDVTWDSDNKYENGEYQYGGIRHHKYFDPSLEYFSYSHKIISRGYAKKHNTPSEWAIDEISEAITKALLPYELQGEYKTNISRQDFCYLIVNMIEQAKRKDILNCVAEKGYSLNNPFTDTDNQNIIAANALGIVNGRDTALFCPNDSITRQEAATMLYRCMPALGIVPSFKTQNTFVDNSDFGSWAIEGINFVSSQKIMNVIGDNQFAPNEIYSREQAYISILRLFNTIESQ